MNLAALRHFAFLTLPNYSMIACANAIEVLRMANRLAGTEAYRWDVVTPDGTPATASNGLAITPTRRLAELRRPDLLLACGGVDVREAVDRAVRTALRRLARDGVALGGLCTGAFALAEAGLLRGRRCAIHWENLAAIELEFPDIAFTNDLYAVDRDRLTCTGGVAPLSLMLAVVTAGLGAGVAASVAAQFLVERVRPGWERQLRPPGPADGALSRAATLMAEHLAAPLSIREIAARVAVSPRQLERLFRAGLGESPATYAAGLRLDRARRLLRDTAMSVTEVASACGYATPSRFSAAYRGRFGHTPSVERRTAAATRNQSHV